MEDLTSGPTPSGESCAQVGSPDYAKQARKECTAFINQLRRLFGEEPDGAYLQIKSNPHDFGAYYEVTVKYDPGDEAAVAYALKCEREAPEEWDEAARDELHGPKTVKAVRARKKAEAATPVKRWIGAIPNCNHCGRPGSEAGFVDGKTSLGPWSIQCPTCHPKYGVGLGTGRGQLYDRTGVKVDG